MLLRFFAVVVALSLSCDQNESSTPEAKQTPPGAAPTGLTGGLASIEELVASVLLALEEQDLARLQQLRVTEAEYTTLLYPDMAAAKGFVSNKPASLHWLLLDRQSRSGLQEKYQEFAGGHLELLAIDAQEEKVYESYKLHKNPRLYVRYPSGLEEWVEIIGSVVERDGQFKLLNYPD